MHADFDDVCKFTSLRILNLDGCFGHGRLEGVTSSLSKLQRLEQLTVAFESRTSDDVQIPMHSALLQLPCLTHLNLAGVRGEMDLLTQLQHLQRLYLGNKTYNLPSSLGHLTSLTALRLYDAEIVGQISVLGTLSKLEDLGCHQMMAEGVMMNNQDDADVLYSAVARLAQLTSLVLTNVWFTFDSSMLQGMSRLQELYLSSDERMLEPLSFPLGCQSLATLTVEIGQMPSLSGLMHLTGLTSLAVSCHYEDIELCEDLLLALSMPSLNTLRLARYQLWSAPSMACIARLQERMEAGCGLCLQKFEQLEYL